MMKKLNLKPMLVLLALLPLGAFAQREDAQLIGTLKSELDYSFKELKKQDAAPYYMSFRVNGLYNATLTSSFGAAAGCSETSGRTFVPQIRLGSPELDNFKYTTQGGRMDLRGQVEQGVMLPLDNGNMDALKEALWRGVLSRYDHAVEVWGQTRSQANVSVADEDKAGCFSEAPVEWQARLDEISAVFKSMPELQQGMASLTFESSRTWFVNTEGSEVVQNRVAARIMLSASVKADDGMELPLNRDYFAYDPDSLPDNAEIIADAQDMVSRLKALKSAPVADPFTGPAILSGPRTCERRVLP